ncbi:hypothetical protein Cgig2_024283 [Carnegiea gigantea]|uniref:Uncharacterized protein n=1 Tax=Carnegiea gigantea TaxID=171969 RepID=A0A9Q1JMP4_9CARY|nr:hypothetical protein Cgig2_024283 [Carnegiea gigantea]
MRTNPKEATRLLLKRVRLCSTLSRLKYQLCSRPLAQKYHPPHNTKEPAQQSKQALSLVAKDKQPQSEKTDNSPPARHEVAKQTKPTVHGESCKKTTKYAPQATNSSKLKLTKEVLPEKDDGKCVGVARTPKKLEEVGPSDALRKRQPNNLPLAYCSPMSSG